MSAKRRPPNSSVRAARRKAVAGSSPRSAVRSGRTPGPTSERHAKSPRTSQVSIAQPPIVKNSPSGTVAAAGRAVPRATGQVGTVLQASGQGISITAHRGDGMVLLAFDLDPKLTANLAGFAVRRVPPSGPAEYLVNRLSFTTKVTAATTPAQRKWTPSDQAPFQKFRWIDFPADTQPGTYRYSATAMYFSGNRLNAGASAELEVPGIQQDAFS